MKFFILYLVILAYSFSVGCYAFATEAGVQNIEEAPKSAYINNFLLNKKQELQTQKQISEEFNTLLPDMEFDTIKLEKGRKFLVMSEQNISNNNISGVPVVFESVQKEYLDYNKKPSKIVFKGIIEKTNKPKFAGKSGSVKIKLEKITVDSITYPVTALISKIDNKKVYFNTLYAAPCYLDNLADAANSGVIHSSIKDPCGADTCTINTYKKPFVFLGAAALQAADLLLSPIIAIGHRGKDIDIPLKTYFEIKLDQDLYVLDI